LWLIASETRTQPTQLSKIFRKIKSCGQEQEVAKVQLERNNAQGRMRATFCRLTHRF
jgi:hypothetical protein